MADQYNMDRWVYGRRWSFICDLDIDDFVLEPVQEEHIRSGSQAPGYQKTTILPQSRNMAGQKTNHSRNLSTHCFRSPRVSNFGYVTATMAIFGSDLLRSARRRAGKPPKVSSPHYRQLCSTVRPQHFRALKYSDDITNPRPIAQTKTQ